MYFKLHYLCKNFLLFASRQGLLSPCAPFLVKTIGDGKDFLFFGLKEFGIKYD